MNRRKTKKASSANELWKWDIMDVEIEKDLSDRLTMYFYGNIYPKKNSKRAFRWIVLPSENYVKRHKIMSDKLIWHKWKYNSFPCRMSVIYVAWSKMKGDTDNKVTSLLDLLVDVGALPDDNQFVVQELEVKNAWYLKNAPICKVELEPIAHPLLDGVDDYKNKDLKKEKEILKKLNVF